MTEPSQPAPRPWTPTERPGDTTYSHPVVYIGDHQLPDTDSDVSSDDYPVVSRESAPVGKAVLEFDLPNRPGPLRFKSSQALREDAAAAAAPEVASYQPYRVSQTLQASIVDIPQSLRPKRSQQALSPKADERLPENNPFRLSKTLHLAEANVPKSPVLSSPSPPSVNKVVPAQTSVSRDAPSQPSVPSRLIDLERSESRAGLIQIVKPKAAPQAEKPTSPEGLSASKSPRLSQSFPSNSDDDLPSVVGKSAREIKILLINPTTNKAITEHFLEYISDSLPADVRVYGFTASRPAPTAIESQTDAIVSTAECTKIILPIAQKYDAFLVATFGHHPLIAALREQLMQPVVGVLEASIYASRMCGSKFGTITTGSRAALLDETNLRIAYGLSFFSVGSESIGLDGVQLDNLPDEEIENRVAVAARRLQMRGADCICLEPTGIDSINKAAQNAIGHHDRMALVIDGMSIGIQFLVGLVRENLGTAKGTLYNISSGHKSLK